MASSSGAASNTLVFSYIIQASDITPDLDYYVLHPNWWLRVGPSGKKAMILLPPPGTKGSLAANKDIFVGSDSTAPTNVCLNKQWRGFHPINSGQS